MADMGAPLDRTQRWRPGQPFTPQNPRLLKIELSETTVMARNGSMVAYQGDVRFEHKGGGLGRLLKKAATGEALRLMQASGSGELFLASDAMLVHVLTLHDDSLTVNGRNILAFEAGIDWDVTRVKGGATGCSPAACSTFNCAAPAWSRCFPTASRCGWTSPRRPRSWTRRRRSRGRAACRRI